MPSRMFPLNDYKPSSSALNLFQAVKSSDYYTSKAIITRRPEVMLELLEIKHRDGSESLISALQYACFSYNTVVCHMFYEAIKNNVDLKERFISQVNKQDAHVDLNPLFASYENFLQAYSNYASKTENITTDPFQAWFEIGAMQRKILQTCLLQDFISMRNGSVRTAQISLQIYDLDTLDYVRLSPNALYQKKAVFLQCIPDPIGEACGILSICYEMPMLAKIEWVKADLATWQTLYQQKLQDYAIFLRVIKQPQIIEEEKSLCWCAIS